MSENMLKIQFSIATTYTSLCGKDSDTWDITWLHWFQSHRLVYKTVVIMRLCPTTPHLQQNEAKFCQWFPFGLWNAHWFLCLEVFFRILSIQHCVLEGHVPKDAGLLECWNQAEGLCSMLCPASLVQNKSDLVHFCTAGGQCPSVLLSLLHCVTRSPRNFSLVPSSFFLFPPVFLRKLLRAHLI